MQCDCEMNNYIIEANLIAGVNSKKDHVKINTDLILVSKYIFDSSNKN